MLSIIINSNPIQTDLNPKGIFGSQNRESRSDRFLKGFRLVPQPRSQGPDSCTCLCLAQEVRLLVRLTLLLPPGWLPQKESERGKERERKDLEEAKSNSE